MLQFAMQHPVATVFIVWLVSDTITVAVKDICSVFDKKSENVIPVNTVMTCNAF